MRGFLLGIIVVGIGFAITYYAAYITDRFGRSVWMEQHLGGTRVGYMLFGFSVMFIGFLLLLGIIDSSGTSGVSDLELGGNTTSIDVQDQ